MGILWTDGKLEQLRALVAEGKTARELEPVFGLSRRGIINIVARHDLGPWIAKPGSKPGDTSHIPADFATLWEANSHAALAEHYAKGLTTISLWARRLGLSRPRGAHIASTAAPMPAGFQQSHIGYTIRVLAVRHGVSKETVRRWISECGVKRDRAQQPIKFVKPNAYATAPVDRPHRDASRAGMAADFLRRFGPVVRCDARGRFDPQGSHWRRGSTVLAAADVIERAERNGWQPDAWKQVA